MYLLQFKNSVKKDFKRIDKGAIKHIKNTLEEFARNFSPKYEQTLLKNSTIKKLQASDADMYRLRLRRYRVIYKKYDEKLVILVLSVNSRENSYK